MKALPLRASLAVSALLILAAGRGGAQQLPPITGLQVTPPPPPPSIVHGNVAPINGFGFWPYTVVHETHVIEREVVHEVPAAPVAPPPPPREPYVIGKSYASLPGGCMKLIQDGGSYFNCSGKWYREVLGGGDPTYKAIEQP